MFSDRAAVIMPGMEFVKLSLYKINEIAGRIIPFRLRMNHYCSLNQLFKALKGVRKHI